MHKKLHKNAEKAKYFCIYAEYLQKSTTFAIYFYNPTKTKN